MILHFTHPELTEKERVLLTLNKEGNVDVRKRKEGGKEEAWEDWSVIDTLPGQGFHENGRHLFKNRKQFFAIAENGLLNVVRYVNLHGHSEYSILDCISRISDIVKKAEWAIAVTDHGNMFGSLEFYKAMKKAGKKPIIGFEAYHYSRDMEEKSHHIVLLAKNAKGVKNLFKMTSNGYHNFNSKPQITWEDMKKHSEGVVCLSACIAGEIPQAIIRGDMDKARDLIQGMIDIFGKENYYLEIQRHGLAEEKVVEEGVFQLADEFGLKVVATTDSHMTNIDDKDVHDIHLCIGTKRTLDDPNRWSFDGDGYHIHTSAEMVKRFEDVPDVLDNTLDLAEMLHPELDTGNVYMPHFPLPEGFKDENDYLKHLVMKGFEKRFEGKPAFTSPEYHERIEFELETVKKMGFPGYFLIVEDFVSYAKNRGIPVGPGRGSACGSLLTYCLGITNVDPIPFGLLFERFLNPDRISMPDIDIDFSDTRREEVINYVREKYGHEAVSGVITFGRMKAKSVVRDVARVMGFPTAFGDRIAKLVPNKLEENGNNVKVTLPNVLRLSTEFKRLYKAEPDVKKVVDFGIRLEGLPRTLSQHACFDGETLITTESGLKRIKDIQVGEKVLTHRNRFKEVGDVMSTQTETVYYVKSVASPTVETTHNHPFYVREKTQKRVKTPKGNSTRIRTYSEPMWIDAEDLEVNNHYVGVAVNQESKIPEFENIDLPFEDKNFWWVVGRYLGDGWTESPTVKGRLEERVIICCSKKNDDLSVIQEKLDALNVSYYVSEATTTFKIYFNQPSQWFAYLSRFGKYAHGKKLPGEVFDLPSEHVTALLEGYLSADGYEKGNKQSFMTVSEELAYGMMQLINKAYQIPAKIQYQAERTVEIEGRQVNGKPIYTVSFFKEDVKKAQSFYENGYIWSRISKVERIEKKNTMYNLTVWDDSSYMANGMIVHNCAILISPSAVSDYIPLVTLKNRQTGGRDTVTQFTMGECEEMGILKMDFLGLRTMGVFERALNYINAMKKTGEKPLFLDDISIGDHNVYDFISKGNTAGVFQLESPGMTGLMGQLYQDIHKMKGTKEEGIQLFERLVAGVSLYRPGPMDEIPNYVKNMLTPHGIHYDIPELEDILKPTYNVIVYQEQVMHIVRQLAGFSKGDADGVRKAMGE